MSLFVVCAWLLACVGAKDAPLDSGPDTAGDSGASPDTGATDTAPDDTAPAPRDLDGDGVDDRTDCDDRDPARTPGADEVWDGVDNDCDERVDADGAYAGTLTLDATGIYQGTPYTFRLTCPLALTRAGRELTLEAVCTPDPADANAQRLLGPRLVVSVTESRVAPAARWSGTFLVTSDSGWDTDGDGTIAFAPTLDRADIAFALSAPFLTASGSAVAAWVPASR